MRAVDRVGRLRGLAFALMLVLPSLVGAATSSSASTSVYLMRGLLDVSTGLDQLAARLKKRGVRARVDSYTAVSSLTAMAIRDYKNGTACPIVLIGHSLGADAAVDMAAELKRSGIPVALLVTFSPASALNVPSNVAQAVNFYQSDSFWNNRAADGRVRRHTSQNIDLAKDTSIDHLNIEKIGRLHARTLSLIAGASGACGGAKKVPIQIQGAVSGTPQEKSDH